MFQKLQQHLECIKVVYVIFGFSLLPPFNSIDLVPTYNLNTNVAIILTLTTTLNRDDDLNGDLPAMKGV